MNTTKEKLLSPFLADNLPLGLNFAVQNRQYANPALSVNLTFPPDWPISPAHEGSPSKNQVVLSLLPELLKQLVNKRGTAQRLEIALSRSKTSNSLAIELEDSDVLALRQVVDTLQNHPLRELFYCLAAGQLEVCLRDTKLVTYLHW